MPSQTLGALGEELKRKDIALLHAALEVQSFIIVFHLFIFYNVLSA